MKAEIVSVGTELLLGDIANTNAQFIAQQLAAVGVDVMFGTEVGDNEARIADVISRALERCDVVIITGGLGPTHDDLTREAIARATDRALQRRAELEDELRRRFEFMGRPMADANLKQADLPAGAEAIANPNGTAPGIFLDHDGKLIFAVPGVPHEMRSMMQRNVVPELVRRGGGEVLFSRTLRCAGVGESDLAARITPVIDRLEVTKLATIALLASAGEVRIRITTKDADAGAAQGRIAGVEAELRAVLGSIVFGADDETLEGVVAAELARRGLTLAIAESVTGGMLASRFVDVPGASAFLRAGYVAYSVDSKKSDLLVPEEVIAAHGAVSEEAAQAMAAGARRRAGADLGLATTGEAGPLTAQASAGTICLALAWKGGAISRRFIAPGAREQVRRWATLGALNLLRLWLAGELE
jgi:competence/damage-inducible protein CinA-like protein